MIKLQHLINLRTDKFQKSNVKLVRHVSTGDYKDILKDRDNLLEYQSFQSIEKFKDTDYLISFTALDSTKALFLGIFKVESVERRWYEKSKKEEFYYTLKEDKLYDDLIDRLVIDWGGSTRNWVQRYDKQDKEVLEILPKGYLGEFKGLTNFILDFDDLKKLIDNPEANRDWKSNLSSINGIYMILDKKTGKQYIGSAYGKGGVWQRWSDYANNVHGDNVLLKELCDSGSNYKQYFQYTVLQSLPSNINMKEVIKIENLFKQKFGTLVHGLNRN